MIYGGELYRPAAIVEAAELGFLLSLSIKVDGGGLGLSIATGGRVFFP